MKWWPFYRQIMDEPLSHAYSADSLYALGIKNEVLGPLDTDEKKEEADLAHKAIRRWFQNNLKDVEPDLQIRHNGNYQDAWFAWRILLRCRPNLFTEAQLAALQKPATRDIVLNHLPELAPKTRASNTEEDKEAEEDPRDQKSARRWPLISALLFLAGTLMSYAALSAMERLNRPELVLKGRDQPIAVMVCPGIDEAYTLKVMLAHVLEATDEFHTVTPAAVRGALGSLEPYLCEDPDNADLDQICKQVGAQFLLWGAPTRAEDSLNWSGRLYQSGRGSLRFQARAAYTESLADAVANACLELTRSQTRLDTSAVFSNSDRLNMLFAEADRQKALGHIQTAYHLYTTCQDEDHLFHLAKLRRAQCAWEMGRWPLAVDLLETLIRDFEHIMPREVLLNATLLQTRLYFEQMDPRFETAVNRAKDLLDQTGAYESAFLLQQEIRYHEFHGRIRDAELLRAALAKSPVNQTDPRVRVLDLMFRAKALQRDGDAPVALKLLLDAAQLAQTHALTDQYFAVVENILDTRIIRMTTSEELKLALAELDTAEPMARAIGNEAWLVMLKYYRGHALSALDRPEEGRELLEQVANQAGKMGLGVYQVRAIFLLAEQANRTGNTTRAQLYLKELTARYDQLPLAQKIWVKRQQALTQFQQGRYQRVLELSNEILAMAQVMALPKEIARELSNKGETLLLMGRLQEAETVLLDAFKRWEKLKDPGGRHAIRHLVTLYDRMNNPSEKERFESLLGR